VIAWLLACAPTERGGPESATDRAANGVLEEVSAGGHTVRAVRDGVVWQVVAVSDGASRVLVPTGGDRLALSPDGAWVAYVAPRAEGPGAGLAAVWVVPFEGGAPRAVTPEPTRRKGEPPLGFVAPPRDRTLAFRGDALCWETGAEPTCVAWR
jgi:hypothetical protein